jgi:hypothetical protein
MWGVIRKLFRRPSVPQEEPVAALPPATPTAEPTPVGVDLERDLRELAQVAREFEPLFAYRPDLISKVTEVRGNVDANVVRKNLKKAVLQESQRLRHSLETLKPQLAQLKNPDLEERFTALLTTLETSLPTRATLDHFHQLYAQELMRLPAEPSLDSEVMNVLATEKSAPEDLMTTAPIQHSIYEQSLEAQGKTLAELKVWMVRYQEDTSSDYQDFAAALTSLQLAQESQLLAPELVLRAAESFHRFENSKQQQVVSQRETQKQHVERQLAALQALPVLPAMQSQAERSKRVFEDYLSQLNYGPLANHVLGNTTALFDNFKKQLELAYRTELMRLVSRATAANVQTILMDLQHAGQLLEGGKYPDLSALAASLNQHLTSEKHRSDSAQRGKKFGEKLQTAQAAFAPLAKLNNDEVDSVRQSLAFLESQREHFQEASVVAQRDLEQSLSQCKSKIKKLAKEFEVTSAVAEELVTGQVLDNLFGEDTSKTLELTTPFTLSPTPKSQSLN